MFPEKLSSKEMNISKNQSENKEDLCYICKDISKIG
jgi:hypothetical protein